MPSDPQTLPAVVHVSSAHPYTDNRIHYRECQTLAEAGYDVTLIAVASDVGGPRSDVRVLTIPKRARVKRVLISSAQAVRLALKSRAKIVHLHDPELIPYIPILRVAGRRVVYDAHEDLPVQVLTKPYAPRWFLSGMSLIAHGLVCLARGSAHRVVAATEQIATRYHEDKTVLVHNYPPLRLEEDNPPERENIVAFVGGMSENRGTKTLLEAVASPEFPPKWELHLAGSGNARILSAIEEAAASLKVVYHGKLPPAGARDLLLRARLGVVNLADLPAHRDSLPTKMFEYFAAGLPVIASNFPLWRRMIEGEDCGTLVDESDPTAIARAVTFYDEYPDSYRRQALNARRNAVDKWNWSSEGAVLITAYADLCST